MKNIIVLLDGLERYHFFKRFETGLEILGVRLVYLTSRYSVYKTCIKENSFIFFINNYRNSKEKISDNYIDSFEVQMKIYTPKSIKRIEVAITTTLNFIEEKFQNIIGCFIWNGSSLEDKIFEQWAKKHSFRILFFELANIPGKIQVDCNGINAKSSLYKNPDLLDSYEKPGEDYYIWKKKYLETKLNNHYVPQSKNVKKTRPGILLDYLSDLKNRRPNRKEVNLSKIISLFVNRRVKYEYSKVDLNRVKYIFFPMQVKSDTQCLINSDLGVEEAFEEAHRIAIEQGLDLIVKPHPAEKDRSFVHRLIKHSRREGVYFVNENTFLLMKLSEMVVTINSSAGLEAKLMGKEVKVLGRATYDYMDFEQIDKYVNSYLIPIEYFSNSDISSFCVNRILSKLH